MATSNTIAYKEKKEDDVTSAALKARADMATMKIKEEAHVIELDKDNEA